MSRSRSVSIAAVLLLPIAGVIQAPAQADTASPFTGLLGGSGEDRAHAVAADSAGAIFIAGVTSSDDLPVQGAFQSSRAGGSDAFVAKIAADGKTLLFATYLGGTGDDEALALVPDGLGGVWVAGVTGSGDFPLQDALKGSLSGTEDAFAAHLSADGASLLSSTYLGGSGDDRALAMTLDVSGNPWVAGWSTSQDFGMTPGAFREYPMGAADAFAVHLASGGNSLLHATYLGGYGNDEVCAILAEESGSVVLAGRTDSDDFPLSSPAQGSRAGGLDAFVARLSPDATYLPYSTYLGGTADDVACSLATGGTGFAVAGTTASTDFPVTGGPPAGPEGGTGAFVAVFTADDSVRYATVYGGSGDDQGLAVAEEAGGAVILVGTTTSQDLPLRAAAVSEPAGATDGFLVRFSGNGNSISYATYFGGSGEDEVCAVALSSSGSVLIAGFTDSGDFATGGPGTGTTAGGSDGFLARVPTGPLPPSGLTVTSATHHKVSLSWTDVSGGRATFEVERRKDGPDWGPIAVLPAETASWVDDSVVPASLYAYRVRAILEGSPSPFGNEVAAVTPTIPVPAMPASPSASAESPTSVRLTWQDASENEISFEVFRAVDGGASVLLRSLSAGATELVDAVAPDRTLSYRVRAVGISGPSPLTPAVSVTTSGTLVVDPVKGRRTDGVRTAKDSFVLLAQVAGPGGEPMPDPRTGGIQIGIGAADGPVLVSVPAGPDGWKDRRGVLTWKSPKGYPVKATVVVNRTLGTLKVKASGLELSPCDAAAVRVWVRCGTEAGSTVDAWLETKPGKLTIED